MDEETKIVTDTRCVNDDEFVFSAGFGFNKYNEETKRLLDFIERHTDIEFVWLKTENILSRYNQAGLLIRKKVQRDE